ncbi:DNA mismatch repair endonuclease MutL [Halorarius litoreus]|uniref:DNA mismatch repair endonuclease MutL n=1 Tax=Halorarius litoreus TaxID=2962676 RepID=UPI0020CCB24F|nr:DNA mismatch repair endonuclease MutL [Halorarius litoreus]
MTDIRQLDQATIDRIAAGEVVERPASVVKELVENSIDADASRVAVTVDAGGTERIEVRDDGAGMTEEEVRLSVKEHTTSKIGDIDDLEAGVATLGFRGEALHAIGAVSKLTVRTRKQGTKQGTELTVEGGEVVDVSPAGCPEGTTIEVADLFYNVPARRKYLKAEATEFSHVNSVVSGYALANPDVAVSLTHGDRETFSTEGRGDRRSAVMAVYGREVAANMVLVEGTDEDGPLDGVSGLVSHPETNRSTREYVNTFVNGRWVTATAVRDAVVEAYGRQLASDRFPFAVLALDVDPGTVDVNVHPRKLEVRFADEDGMRRQVRDAVESALLSEGLIRTSAPRGRSKAAQTEIAPERADRSGSEASEPSDTPDASTGLARRPETDPERDTNTGGAPAWATTDTETAERASEPGNEADSSPGEPGVERISTGNEGVRDRRDRKFRERPAQATFDGSNPDDHAFDTLPSMRVLGQLHDTYVVAETDDGLVLVDQHAADERVNFERLRERFAREVTTQALAEPVDLELTAKEAALAEAAAETLSQLGFHASLVDDRTLRVTTVPALLADEAGPELVRDLVADFADGDPDRTVEQAADELLGDLACYPSIKGNESLTEGTVTDLLRALDACENPYACPHGRPVVIELGTSEIEERFERDYPGHGS